MDFVGTEHNPEFFNKARANLAATQLSKVTLKQLFFDAQYTGQHEVILTRFTLQHASRPQGFIRSVYQALCAGGCFLCIDPIKVMTNEEHCCWRIQSAVFCGD
jgi:hypothetical protein